MIALSVLLIIGGVFFAWLAWRAETPHQRFAREITARTLRAKDDAR